MSKEKELSPLEKKIIQREEQRLKEVSGESVKQKLDRMINLLEKILYAIQGLAIVNEEDESLTMEDLMNSVEENVNKELSRLGVESE